MRNAHEVVDAVEQRSGVGVRDPAGLRRGARRFGTTRHSRPRVRGRRSRRLAEPPVSRRPVTQHFLRVGGADRERLRDAEPDVARRIRLLGPDRVDTLREDGRVRRPRPAGGRRRQRLERSAGRREPRQILTVTLGRSPDATSCAVPLIVGVVSLVALPVAGLTTATAGGVRSSDVIEKVVALLVPRFP